MCMCVNLYFALLATDAVIHLSFWKDMHIKLVCAIQSTIYMMCRTDTIMGGRCVYSYMSYTIPFG